MRLSILLALAIALASSAKAEFKTWQDIRWDNITRQQEDYSCGAASVSMLFEASFGEQITESELLQSYLDHLEPSRVEIVMADGLTLLDLAQMVEQHGYAAHAVRIEVTELIEANRPAIVYIERDDYRHFVLFNGAVDDQISLRDPAVGNRRIFVEQFNEMWKGGTALFVSRNGAEPLSIEVRNGIDRIVGLQNSPPLRSIRNLIRGR